MARRHDDVVEVGELLARYGAALDSRDWKLLATCFLADADLTYADSGRFTTYAAFEEMARTTLARCTATQHLIGTVSVVADGDSATAHSYAQAAHVMVDGALAITGVQYDDQLTRTPNGWRIAHREMRRMWGRGPQPRAAGPGPDA